MAGETLVLQTWHFFLRFPFFIYSEERELELHNMYLKVSCGELFLYVDFDVY